jgi:hypothetical protein
VRGLIYKRAGISLADSKQEMVYSRLARRLRATGIGSFAKLPRRPGSGAPGRRVGIVHQRADHQPDLVLPRSPPLPAAGRARQAQARTGHDHDLVLGQLDRRGAVFDRDDPVRSVQHADAAGQIIATDIDTNVLATAERASTTSTGSTR